MTNSGYLHSNQGGSAFDFQVLEQPIILQGVDQMDHHHIKPCKCNFIFSDFPVEERNDSKKDTPKWRGGSNKENLTWWPKHWIRSPHTFFTLTFYFSNWLGFWMIKNKGVGFEVYLKIGRFCAFFVILFAAALYTENRGSAATLDKFPYWPITFQQANTVLPSSPFLSLTISFLLSFFFFFF